MLQTITRTERRSSDKLGTMSRCLGHAFRPETTTIFDELIAAIDAADEGRSVATSSAEARPTGGTGLKSLKELAYGDVILVSDLAETGPTGIWDDQMMPLLLKACPSFQEHWDLFYKVDAADPSESNAGLTQSLPLYLAVHDLARHIARNLDCGETSELPAVFEVVERWIVEGSETVRSVAISGFLEDLLLPHIFVLSSPKELLRWVGPRTYKWWVEANGFWDRLAANMVTSDGY